jgi:hypothetical protein
VTGTHSFLKPAPHTSAYVSMRQHTSAYVSIRQHSFLKPAPLPTYIVYVSIRQHTSAYVSRGRTLHEDFRACASADIYSSLGTLDMY